MSTSTDPTSVPTEDPRPDDLRRADSLVLVNTGHGKGKSTAAFGVVMRAVARGWPVAVVQFLKSAKWHTGEEEVGRRLAERGAVVLCGGLGGVMAAVARGVRSAGGTCVGLLPGEDPAAAAPDVTVAVPTGMGEMRNALLARACAGMVAIGGGYGTLSEVGLADKRDQWPSVLSGGQKQRVALARALVSRPRVLAFDEPLGALDALTRISMQRLLERVWRDQGFTAILVTHDVAEAVALANRVLVIEEGRIAHDVVVNAGRPRQRGSAELAGLEGSILNHLLSGDDRT